MSIKDKVMLVSGSILAFGLSISGILLARGKMFSMAADGFAASALLAAASKEKFMGMGEMFRGMGEFAQSVPSVLAWGAVFVLAAGGAISLVLISHSLSRVHIERNKYLVASGTVVEKKLLGRGVPVRSLPFPVTGGPDSPDLDDESLEGDDPDKYIRQRVISYVNR